MNPFINVGINQAIGFLCVLGQRRGAFCPAAHSLAWMKKQILLSTLFGALGGPLAYWAGVRLGAATFHWPLLSSLALLAVAWAFLWTGVMAVAARQALRQDDDLVPPE